MKLIEPSMEYDEAIQAYRRDYLKPGASMEGGGSLLRYERTEDWLEHIKSYRSWETVAPDRVPCKEYLFLREEDRTIVGAIQIRPELNEKLRLCGGHIGYSVAPSERRKGYAAEMLREALEICRELGLARVLITCGVENEGSRRTILKNGGVYESTVCDPTRDRWLERYWIEL